MSSVRLPQTTLSLVALLSVALVGCGSSPFPPAGPRPAPGPGSPATPGGRTSSPPLPGGPRRPGNVYFADGAGMLSPAVAGQLSRVYVPNTMSNTVDVIDPDKMRVVGHFSVGQLPQHVTPAYDLKTLYVDNDLGNTLTRLDPTTGRPRGKPIPVADPYNLYFTPTGDYAIVVAERLKQLDFRDPHTMALRHTLHVPGCAGVDHMDFSAQGSYLYASCEFGGSMIEVDVRRRRVVKTLRLAHGVASPQDVKLAPDGKVLYVADQAGGGVWKINAHSFRTIGFMRTGAGAHGLYPSRDARYLYVSNRGEGTVSVVSFATRRVVHRWKIPGKASPDMGGVSSDGRTLWLSGRYDAEVYALDTTNGHLRARIRVGQGPHGLSVWPQPGRFSLGHTGIMR